MCLKSPVKDHVLCKISENSLNNHYHINKYSMKDITECIVEIGHANSTTFTTLDLASGFWQMPLHPDDAYTTAFTVLGQRAVWVDYQSYGTMEMSFQRMMERVLQKKHFIFYIDDVLIHSKLHDEMLIQLVLTFERLQKHGIKVNL